MIGGKIPKRCFNLTKTGIFVKLAVAACIAVTAYVAAASRAAGFPAAGAAFQSRRYFFSRASDTAGGTIAEISP
jgi:hypothetical protein